ncbi:MAG: hypothetical protein O2884_11570 [Chloroflexi bacterium]|nr:hypothetical protein [Chloroflexota bacterium]
MAMLNPSSARLVRPRTTAIPPGEVGAYDSGDDGEGGDGAVYGAVDEVAEVGMAASGES